jgi:hypothetical protein
MVLKPENKPDGMNQDYWDARNKVSIDIHTYFKWINGEWDAQKAMSGQYLNYAAACRDGCERQQSTTHASTTYVSVMDGIIGWNQGLRKNDCPESDGTGPVPRYNKGTCDDFNLHPSQYGQIPEEDLKKRRYNVCFPAQATAYFNTTYKRKDIPFGGECSCGSTGPDPSGIQPGTNTDSRTFQTSTCGPCDCGGNPPTKSVIKCYWGSCRTIFYSLVSISSFGVDETWYDVETKKVYPAMYLGGAYPNFGWLGFHPKDTPARGPEGKHLTSTKVTVDGVDIPCGTSWSTGGESGYINLSVTYTVKERDL